MKRVVTAAVFAAAGLFLTGTQASAAISCDEVLSIGDWSDAGSCDIGDKRYTFGDTTFGDSFDVVFLTDGINYTFVGDGNVHGPLDATISYSVEVLDPSFRIVTVELDSTISGFLVSPGTTTVTKSIEDSTHTLIDTLTSTDGSADSATGLSETLLYITDTVHLVEGDTMTAFQNTVTQEEVVVPEPASMTLLGLGLAGVAAARRRRQA